MTSGELQISTNVSVEERLALVEAAVMELQKQVATSQPRNWLSRLAQINLTM